MENFRWWFERWFVGVAYVLKQFRFPVKVNVEWVGLFPSRGLDDAKHEWDQREFVQYYIWTFTATEEQREKFGKTQYCDSK